MRALAVPEAAEIGVGQADRQVRRLAVVAPAQDLAVCVDPGQGLAVGERHVEPHRPRPVEPAIEQREQRLAPLPGRRRQRHAVDVALRLVEEAGALGLQKQVDQVEHLDQPNFGDID